MKDYTTWEDVLEAYRNKEITESDIIDLMDWFNIR